jgi:serine/threonine protein kinase
MFFRAPEQFLRKSQPAQTRPTAETDTSSHALSRQSTDFGLSEGGKQAEALVGLDLGGVIIEQFIAEGGMGQVYEARQLLPSRNVAVKIMRPGHRSPQALARFRRETNLLGQVVHPGVAQIYAAGCFECHGEQVPYYVMELVPGSADLISWACQNNCSIQKRLRLFLEICQAVAHGHAQGIIHRDLKPGNILVTDAGHPKVIDFGIARCDSDDVAMDVTQTGVFLGTRQYTSPEQCDGGTVDARTDVYALGIILHELLTGQPPYEVPTRSLLETARVIRNTPPARLRLADRGLSRVIDAIATRCLAKRPADRYATAAQLADDVARALDGRPVSARPAYSLEPSARWLRQHLRTIAISLVTAVVSIMAASWLGLTVSPSAITPEVAAGLGLQASFANISSGRTTPLQWLSVTFSEPIQSLNHDDFRLTHNGTPRPLTGVQVVGTRSNWEIRGLDTITAAEGDYCLELTGTEKTPVDFAGRLLSKPAQVTWSMPPYREFTLSPLEDSWKEHVVTMNGVDRHTEKSAGSNTFFRPTELNREGTVVLRFLAPFEVRAATLSASIAVWTTGDPFPYDPGARAALDVSPDGQRWTTLDIREANHGGFGGGPFEIDDVVSGSREVWVRARLTATRVWPEDGPIFAQFLRTKPGQEKPAFQLRITGPSRVQAKPGVPIADG